MTNMEGVGLAFFIVIIGIPVLCVAVIAGYLAHRSGMKKNEEQGIPEPVNVSTPGMFRDLVLRPDAFFRTVSKGSDTIFTPVLWLFVGSFAISVGMMAAVDLLYFVSGFENVLFLTLVAWVLMTCAIVLAWIALSGVLYVASHLFHGSGSFKKTLQNAGYGLAPGLVLYSLFLLLGTLALTALQIPVIPFGNPSPGNPLLSIIGRAGTLIASLWVFVLLTYGLCYARNIPRVKAAVLAGVPIVIFLIFSNLQYLTPA